ncbi:hypothetical protein C7293_02985 [filamentous cyanobacterium CCT1]|nr:hypothetical protein C7293_02985 [filamentous cyanobacterium CCT1]PSN80622.1 hypothetical protein C8B47_05570 [filamentous cyanobacterium CCP4]
MTVQDLLREATQLSLKEQLQLATQLLQLVNQQLDYPSNASNPAVGSSTNSNPATTNTENEEGSISYLLAHPIPVQSFTPLSRDEIYDRC